MIPGVRRQRAEQKSSSRIFMTNGSLDIDALRHLLPAANLGEVREVAPIHMGLSGAGVYAITTSRGEFILRVEGAGADLSSWRRQLLLLRRVAEHGIAPPIVHADEEARAFVQERASGLPLHLALADPSQRGPAMAGVVMQVRALHALDPGGMESRDPIAFVRAIWEVQRLRPGFPGWAEGVGAALDTIEPVLARDRRTVVSHNDLNPGNILWDGERAWLIDWNAAGLTHPYYDLAALATFLSLDSDTAHGLLALQEQTMLDDAARTTFAALRRVVELAAGCMFLSLMPDLTALAIPAHAEGPTPAECFAELRAGRLDLQQPSGRAAIGLAFLRAGLAPRS
jgi:aminoglycoside phosphotransferase (APT) family kinase protein